MTITHVANRHQWNVPYTIQNQSHTNVRPQSFNDSKLLKHGTTSLQSSNQSVCGVTNRVKKGERETEREKERQTDRQTETERQTDRDRDRQTINMLYSEHGESKTNKQIVYRIIIPPAQNVA